jgi:hypothetical protein
MTDPLEFAPNEDCIIAVPDWLDVDFGLEPFEERELEQLIRDDDTDAGGWITN